MAWIFSKDDAPRPDTVNSLSARTIAVSNLKGGVGKTTMTVNLGAALANAGKKVLIVDLDPQANMTDHLGVDFRQVMGVEKFLGGEESFEDCYLVYNDNLHFLPAGRELAKLETALYNMSPAKTRRYYSIKEAFEPSGLPYEYIILDCPPSLGFITINALAFAQSVFVPIQCHYLALRGLGKILALVDVVKKKYNPDLEIGAVVPVMYDQRNNMSAFVLEKLKNHFDEKVTDTKIRTNVSLADAPRYGRTIFDHRPDSNGAKDFKKLAAEILKSEVAAAEVTAETEDSQRPST